MINTRIGTQNIGGYYHFTEEGSLIEGAKEILKLGSDILKVSLTLNTYKELNQDKTVNSLVDIAKIKQFHTVFSMPFKYYILWAHTPHINGKELDNQVLDDTYHQMYELTKYLLTTFNDSHKVFLLGNWEGDWLIRDSQDYDLYKNYDEERINHFTEIMKIRQKAVEDARKNINHHHIMVGHYVEVNLVLGAKDRNLNRVVNKVLPNIIVDLVSYSSYDALYPLRLTEALDYIEQNANFTDYFNQLFDKLVFIGEMDSMCEYTQKGYVFHQNSYLPFKNAIYSALNWGVPFVLYWELYSNVKDQYFCLIDESGKKNDVYYILKNIIGKLLFLNIVHVITFSQKIKYTDLSHLAHWCEMTFKEVLETFIKYYKIDEKSNIFQKKILKISHFLDQNNEQDILEYLIKNRINLSLNLIENMNDVFDIKK